MSSETTYLVTVYSKLGKTRAIGNVFISCATDLYLHALTSNIMSELIIESHKKMPLLLC